MVFLLFYFSGAGCSRLLRPLLLHFFAREFHIINDENVKVFQAVIESQGRGVGIDTPTVASPSWPQPQLTRPKR
jgi:hypothetical protein